MTGEYSGKAPESTAGDGLMDLLRKLKKEEILEVLSDGFCQHCEALLHTRIQNLIKNRKYNEISISNGKPESSTEFWSVDSSHLPSLERSPGSSTNTPTVNSTATSESVYSGRWNGSPASVSSKRLPVSQSGSDTLLNGGNGLSENEERIRVSWVGRKKDFSYIERINGKATNVLQGLELHTQVFNDVEQKKIVECVYNLQRMGQAGQLRERTFTEPKKWMRGKGRVTIQFGCCYNYAVDKNGNPPGIIRDEEVDPLPPLFKQMIKRMVRWNVLPPTCVPNSCIVNIYDEGDCIPPHIDHHDFLRPFCTVSFLTECNILFGANLKILGPGEFSGPFSMPLPVGSVLILSGNGADVAKHCVPGVPAKRISITFRKMDETKIPYAYKPDPELLGVKPVTRNRLTTLPLQQNLDENKIIDHNKPGISSETANNSFRVDKDEFPPLGSLSSSKRRGSHGNGSRPYGNGSRP